MDVNSEVFFQNLFKRSGEVRLTKLFRECPSEALYKLSNRCGVCVTAVRTRHLDEHQIIQLLTYRLAQYVAINFVDARNVYELRMDHEPISNTSADEIHVIAGSAETGEILCYLAVKGGTNTPSHVTMRTQERPLLPSEQRFGWGVYNRLTILPDLPLAKVREVGRFVKNHQRSNFDELVIRATAEVGTALFKLLVGAARQDIDACVGNFEEEVAKKNLDFFHVPLVVLHGVVPFAEERDYLRPHVEARAVYPFAFLLSDLSTAMGRLESIEQALARPGRDGLSALMTLKKDGTKALRSTLEPPGGIPALNDVQMHQEHVDMDSRRELLKVGDALRMFEPFSGLSSAEAAVLGTILKRVEVQSGESIVRQGDVADALYLIEAGEADIQAVKADGTQVKVKVIGPGSFFGEIGLVTGSERTANVIAKTHMRLLRLSKKDYNTYLSHFADADNKFSRMALEKVQEQLRNLKA